MSEHTPEEMAALEDMEDLAVSRYRATGRPCVVCGFTGSGRARVLDADLETAETVDRGSVPVGPLWPE